MTAKALVVIGLALLAVAAPVPVAAQCPAAARSHAAALRWDEAFAEAGAHARRNSRDAEAHACVGRIAVALDRAADAVAAYERAVELGPRSAEYQLRLGEALGLRAQQVGRLRSGVLARRVKAAFERAVALDPRQVDARMGLVQFYSMAPAVMGGSTAQAREQVAEIMRISRMRGNMAAGMLAEQLRDPAAAERAYLAAVAASPTDSAAAHLALGLFYQRREEWSKAFAVYDRLLASRPAETAARQHYGRAASLSGQNLARGERELRAWLANRPADTPVVMTAAVHHRLGAVLERLGRRDEARAEYRTAVRMNPRNVDAARALRALR